MRDQVSAILAARSATGLDLTAADRNLEAMPPASIAPAWPRVSRGSWVALLILATLLLAWTAG